MKKENYGSKVIPGYAITRLTKEEVGVAVFVFAYGRNPTLEEIKRLSFNVNDNYHSAEEKWELVLNVKDLR